MKMSVLMIWGTRKVIKPDDARMSKIKYNILPDANLNCSTSLTDHHSNPKQLGVRRTPCVARLFSVLQSSLSQNWQDIRSIIHFRSRYCCYLRLAKRAQPNHALGSGNPMSANAVVAVCRPCAGLQRIASISRRPQPRQSPVVVRAVPSPTSTNVKSKEASSTKNGMHGGYLSAQQTHCCKGLHNAQEAR